MKYRCPCCGYFTLEGPNGGYDICPVCFWEDEGVIDPYNEEECGANHVSCLNEGRENYIKYGACEKDMVKYTRKPKDDELDGIDIFPIEFWRNEKAENNFKTINHN